MSKIIDQLPEKQQRIVKTIKSHSETLLDKTPRFKYFTLHGKKHIDGIFKIIDLLVEHAELKLTNDEAFLLSCAI